MPLTITPSPQCPPRVLVGLVVVLGVVAVAGGGVGVVLGPIPGDGAGVVTATTDSEYRFLSGTWLCWGLLAWWSVRRPVERARVTQAFLAVAFVGGLARLVSLLVLGSPGPLLVTALVVELTVVPSVLAWHLVDHHRRVAGPSST